MTKVLSNTQNSIIEILDTRLAEAPNSNWEKNVQREKVKMSTGVAADFFDEDEKDITFLHNICVYGLQKVRKLIDNHTGARSGSVDNYTTALFMNARIMANKGKVFTAGLATASMSNEVVCEDDGIVLLSRLSSGKSTASTQSSSSRKALEALNLATYRSVNGKTVIDVDFTNPVVMSAMGLDEEEVGELMVLRDAAHGTSEAPDEKEAA